jgi:hypothetical protein
MRLRFLICLAGISLSLAACNPADKAPAANPVTQVAPANPAAPTAAAPAADGNGATIWFEPAALSTCAKHEKVAVHWDASKLPGVTSIEIHPLNGTKEALFARTPRPVGKKMTGPWMRAGAIMILRNEANGAEIGRATMAAMPCTQ